MDKLKVQLHKIGDALIKQYPAIFSMLRILLICMLFTLAAFNLSWWCFAFGMIGFWSPALLTNAHTKRVWWVNVPDLCSLVCCTLYSGGFILYYLFFGIQIYFDGENTSDADHVEQFRIEMASKFWLISIYYLILFIVAVLCAVGSGASMYSAYLERNKYLVFTIKERDVESGRGILDGID